MKKRFGKLSILASLGLSAVLLATACGGGEGKAGDNSNESKSIRVFFGDAVKTDNDEVSAAVSKMSEEKIGVKVEMVFFGAGEYDKKMPKLIATNEKMDIGWDSGDNFVSRAKDRAYYDISSDLDAYPALKELFPEKFLAGVTIDGGVYGIPTLKEMANNWAWYCDEPTLTKYNIDVDKIDTVADLEPLLAALKSEGRLGIRIYNTGEHKAFDIEKHFDTITGPFVISNDDDEKLTSKKIVNYYETEEFADYVRLMHSWFEKGYILSDVMEEQSTYDNITTTDPTKRGLQYVCYSPLNEVGASRGSVIGNQIPIQITEPVVSNSSTRGSIFCIYKKSENKQSSLKFLELWNTDKEMNTLIKYGIEGKHYNWIEEDGVKKVERTEGAMDAYLNQGWRSGNMLLGTIEQGEPANKVEEFEKWNAAARESVVLGFNPDVSNLESEISACNAVVTSKAAALLTGAIDPDNPDYGIEAVKKEMQSAGSKKVVTELQKQFLTWAKEK